jgi:hypothetical protein
MTDFPLSSGRRPNIFYKTSRTFLQLLAVSCATSTSSVRTDALRQCVAYISCFIRLFFNPLDRVFRCCNINRKSYLFTAIQDPQENYKVLITNTFESIVCDANLYSIQRCQWQQTNFNVCRKICGNIAKNVYKFESIR